MFHCLKIKTFSYIGRPRQLWLILAGICMCFLTLPARAQQSVPPPALVVQPGAPGQPTRTLPPSTTAKLPPRSSKDVEFMQGMIMHHAQAVEMVALMAPRTENSDLRRLGERISQSQSDEINFMKRWLESRGEDVSMKMGSMDGMEMSGMNHASHQMQMPGMLTTKQMDSLRKAKGPEFDRLFLTGMIQHHAGALVMVKDLYDTAGGGQDAEIFTFATEVDSGQRAEIKLMQNLLKK